MAGPVDNTTPLSSLPDSSNDIVAAAGTQLSSSLGPHSNAGLTDGLTMDNDDKDASPSAPGQDWSRLGHPDNELPRTAYQAASNGTSYYHSYPITHPNSHISTNFVPTALAADHYTLPIVLADRLQNDIDSVRNMARLANSVNAPCMFDDDADSMAVEDMHKKRREERQVAGRRHVRRPHGAVRIGSHCVPILDRPLRDVILPGNDDPAYFSCARILGRRPDPRTADAESLAAHLDAGDVGDALYRVAGSPGCGAGPIAGGAGTLPGEPGKPARGDGREEGQQSIWPFRDSI